MGYQKLVPQFANVDDFRLIVVRVGSMRRPVEFFYLHAEIADYFHHGGQRFQIFGLQTTKWIELSVSL